MENKETRRAAAIILFVILLIAAVWAANQFENPIGSEPATRPADRDMDALEQYFESELSMEIFVEGNSMAGQNAYGYVLSITDVDGDGTGDEFGIFAVEPYADTLLSRHLPQIADIPAPRWMKNGGLGWLTDCLNRSGNHTCKTKYKEAAAVVNVSPGEGFSMLIAVDR